MSKNAKVILIIVGILAFLSITCVGGLIFIGYNVVDHEGVEKNSKEGTEFGKTTDNFGCQTKIVSMVKSIQPLQLNETLKAQYFFDSCLAASRFDPKFCERVPSDWTDIMNDDKGKEAECEKLGLKGSVPCRQVMKEKLDFCDTKR